MLERVRELIREAMEEFPAPEGRGLASNGGWEVLPAESPERGHFSTNAAFQLAKQMNVSSMAAAEELKKYLLEERAPSSAKATAGKNFFSKIDIADPGFLNLWIKPEVVREEFERMVGMGSEWGKPRKDASRPRGKVIVEYSQPNIAKPLQAHHLRSTIIGDALANVLEFAGHEVIRWNYLGDWGTQFGNVIAAYKLWGDKSEVEKAPVKTLAGLYVRFHEEAGKDPSLAERGREEFRKLETGDKENRELWEWFKEESIKELNKIYELLNVEFDEWISESFYEKKLPPLIESLLEKGIAKESEGAIVVPLTGLPPALIRKSDEGTLYLTRDIANLEYRLEEYKADSVLYVVDNGQSLHFQQLFAIAGLMGLKGDFHHIKFGLLLGGDLKRLSTRAGTGIELEEVISEATSRARKVMEEKEVEMSEEEKDEVAKIVGIGALKYNDLSQNRVADITFDWDKMLLLQGNSAPYLQYTYARLKSILRKAGDVPKLEAGRIEKEADLRLILKLAYFPEAVEAVCENYLPHQITNYLYDLARAINDYYEREPILKSEEPLRTARLYLIQSAANTLKIGLALLGIKTVERM